MRKLGPLLVVAVVLLAACSGGTPDIEVATEVDLGTVAKGELAAATIPVSNRGDGPLTITGVSTSCGCTKATISSMTIPAGGSETLKIVYDSNAHETDSGTIERYVFVSSDDPDEDDVQIKFRVVVKTAGS